MVSLLKIGWLVLNLAMVIISCPSVWAMPEFSGMTEIQQPNGVTFRGQWWGDEFAMTYETAEGYRFVPRDGWCYYAVLDERGEFEPSPWRVGIDDPAGHRITGELGRSAAREAEIQAERARWQQGEYRNVTSGGGVISDMYFSGQEE